MYSAVCFLLKRFFCLILLYEVLNDAIYDVPIPKTFSYGVFLIALISFPACFHSASDGPSRFDASIQNR